MSLYLTKRDGEKLAENLSDYLAKKYDKEWLYDVEFGEGKVFKRPETERNCPYCTHSEYSFREGIEAGPTKLSGKIITQFSLRDGRPIDCVMVLDDGNIVGHVKDEIAEIGREFDLADYAYSQLREFTQDGLERLGLDVLHEKVVSFLKQASDTDPRISLDIMDGLNSFTDKRLYELGLNVLLEKTQEVISARAAMEQKYTAPTLKV